MIILRGGAAIDGRERFSEKIEDTEFQTLFNNL